MSVFEPLGFVPLFAWAAVAAVLLALLEIQIEGANGWASALPTWRYGAPWVRRLLNGKDLTGYHLLLWSLLLVLFHLPLAFVAWSPAFELTILSAYLAFAVLWDALWFAMNPAMRGRRRSAWWFRSWIGPVPLDYWTGLGSSAALAAIRGLLPGAAMDGRLGGVPAFVQHAAGWALGCVAAGVIAAMAAVLVRRTWSAAASAPPALSVVAATEPDVAAVSPGLSRPLNSPTRLPVDPMTELVSQEERLRKAQWLVQFAEILLGIVVGLSLQHVADSNLFRPEPRPLIDMLVAGAPLLLLYAWIVVYVVLYWYNMRVEMPVFAIFIRQIAGLQHLLLVVVLGFIFFQAFDAALVDFATVTPGQVAVGVDRVLTWLGVLIAFDLVAQAYLRGIWLRSIARLERDPSPVWAPYLGRVRRYYGRLLATKTAGLALAFGILFFPGLPVAGSPFRYPLLTALGIATPLVVAAAFVAVNLAFEVYLLRQRRIVHDVAARMAVELRRLEFDHAEPRTLLPSPEQLVQVDAAGRDRERRGRRPGAGSAR